MTTYQGSPEIKYNGLAAFLGPENGRKNTTMLSALAWTVAGSLCACGLRTQHRRFHLARKRCAH